MVARRYQNASVTLPESQAGEGPFQEPRKPSHPQGGDAPSCPFAVRKAPLSAPGKVQFAPERPRVARW
jgi:hypothetical protein